MRGIWLFISVYLLFVANIALANPYATGSFGIGLSTFLPVVVTVSPSGSVSISSNDLGTDVEMDQVRTNVSRQISCPDGFSTLTISVQEAVNGYTSETFKLVMGSDHFKGMKNYFWQAFVPIAKVSSLVSACKMSLTPDHEVDFLVKYTCNGKNEIKYYYPTTYDLVCQPPPPVTTTKPGPVTLQPASTTPRPTACKKPGDCPRGTSCISGYCK